MSWFANFWQTAMNQLAMFRITDAIDILAVSFLVYKALKFIRDTKTMQLLKGIVLLVVVTQVSALAHLNTLYYILSNVLQLGLIAWLILFQPELRQVLERMGRSAAGKWFNSKGEIDETVKKVIHDVAHAAQAMANSKTGALIVLEKEDVITRQISAGVVMDAEVSSALLENIFVPNTPLHDGAVVIRDNKIALAACVLPLSQNPNIRQNLGTRHRAGIGISEESDAIAVIVSEETGAISVAFHGELTTGLREDTLRDLIVETLDVSVSGTGGDKKFSPKAWMKRGKKQ